MARRRPRRPVRGRWAAVISVLAVVIGIGIVSAALPVPAAAPPPGAFDGIPVPPVAASSSSAFCAAGTGDAAATTIYLTNSTARAVTAVMTSVGPEPRHGPVPTVRRAVAVPPLGTAAVDPSTGLPQGSSASSFAFAGGGVVASQVVSGPLGWSTAPCASRTSSQWAFSGGSTTAGNSLKLALFNPAAPAATVNITFLTPSGLVTPQAYQGLVVPPGRLIVENVGAFVQRAAAVATFVTSQAGGLVSTEFQETSAAERRRSLPPTRIPRSVDGVADGTDHRRQGGDGRFRSGQSRNPAGDGDHLLRVGVRLGDAPATVDPTLSLVAFVASTVAGIPHQVPYSVAVDSSGPIVVGRSVLAGKGAGSPQWGSSSATVTAATHWLVPGPGSSTRREPPMPQSRAWP